MWVDSFTKNRKLLLIMIYEYNFLVDLKLLIVDTMKENYK